MATTAVNSAPDPARPVGDGNNLEADETVASDEADSGVGSDAESFGSASITSSIVGYKYENGRRYHA